MIKAIIFDVDGTLAETEEAHRAAFNVVFREFGLSWNWDIQIYGKLLSVTGGKERIASYVEGMGLPAFEPDRVKAMHLRKNELYAKALKSGLAVPRQGVLTFVEEASDLGLQLAIATTTSRENFVALLSTAFPRWSLGMFSSIVCGENVVRKKPDPEVYQACLREMDIQPPAAIAVEDSEVGLRSATQAGLHTIVTPSSYTRHQSFGGAIEVLPNLEVDLRQLLKRISKVAIHHS